MLYSQRAAETKYCLNYSCTIIRNISAQIYRIYNQKNLHKINVNDPRCDIRYPVGDDFQLQHFSMNSDAKILKMVEIEYDVIAIIVDNLHARKRKKKRNREDELKWNNKINNNKNLIS